MTRIAFGFSRKVGFRYLLSKKGSSFLSLITVISVGGIAVGILTMIVTLSVMAGFESELKKRLFAAETHILVEQHAGFFKQDPGLIMQLQTLDSSIRQVFPVLQTEVILRAGKKVNGSILKGIETAQMEWLKTQVHEWAPEELLEKTAEAKLFMGQEMAFNMGIIPGDVLSAVSPVETEGPLGVVPRMKRFLVAGLYKTGVPEQELHVVFVERKEVESFLRRQDIISQIELKVDDLDKAAKVTQTISKKLGLQFLVRSWQDLNAHLFHSLRLERITMFCILIFIVVVATFNIVSTLTMMVVEKRKSLSILRAIGATRSQVAKIFLWEGLAIGIFGAVIGTAMGLGICKILSVYPIIELPEFYYDRSLPIVIQWQSILLVLISALSVVFLGSLLPARKAAELSPIEGIRQG